MSDSRASAMSGEKIVFFGCWESGDGEVFRVNPDPDAKCAFELWTDEGWVNRSTPGLRPYTQCQDPSVKKPLPRSDREARDWLTRNVGRAVLPMPHEWFKGGRWEWSDEHVCFLKTTDSGSKEIGVGPVVCEWIPEEGDWGDE